MLIVQSFFVDVTSIRQLFFTVMSLTVINYQLTLDTDNFAGDLQHRLRTSLSFAICNKDGGALRDPQVAKINLTGFYNSIGDSTESFSHFYNSNDDDSASFVSIF